jgi:LytS/YehU family sensor histidine kinase
MSEEAGLSYSGWINERIVSLCAAGLVVGPWVGLAVAVFVTAPRAHTVTSAATRVIRRLVSIGGA